MVTTRDQVEAYTYESRRQVTSLMLGADEAVTDPRRRLNRSTVGGTVIAVLLMAGFGIAGFLGGGSGPALPGSGAVTVSGTGDHYVIVDGQVHPALNLASALLVGGGSLTEVRSEVLAGKPRGLPVGIPNAPDSLPSKDNLTNGAWTVCALQSGSVSAPSQITLLIGAAPSQGTLDSASGVLAQLPDDSTWLISKGRRYKLTGNTRALLGLQRAATVRLPAEVLAVVPEGAEITQPSVTSGGAPTVQLPSPVGVGDVIQTRQTGVQEQFFVVEPDGLAPISELTYALLAASGSRVDQLDANVAVSAPQSHAQPPGSNTWPDRIPQPVGPQLDQPLCLSTTPGQAPGDAPWQLSVSLPPAMPSPSGLSTVTTKAGHVTNVKIAAGSGAVVKASSAAGQDGVLTLVTDSGQRFPIPSADAASRLHFDPNAAKNVPLPFVTLLPAGPTLDPTAAAEEFPGGN
ncbi:type VII secretion protein EccB [Kutzneria sp. 744]|uniref:type VII secretion protein EccB n=1 Tax=Kutzneria sp. (strain 744) TaxID=345341 RepID=UPI0003EEC601|nr:type VII secretion protein EccB [Kutzneria sp. 744]EWM15198.1 LigA protein [Kutzneria sp. 744]